MPILRRGSSVEHKQHLKPLIFILAASLMVMGAALTTMDIEPAGRQQTQENDAFCCEEIPPLATALQINPENETRQEKIAFYREEQRTAITETAAAKTGAGTGSGSSRETGIASAVQPARLQDSRAEAAGKNNYFLSRGGQRINYLDVYTVTATAYCPGTVESGCPHDSKGRSACTGRFNDGFTATGVKAVAGDGSREKPHLVAVDPAVFPLGSLFYIEGYGFAVAADTGQAIKGLRMDLLFPDHESALRFGRRRLRVYRLPQ